MKTWVFQSLLIAAALSFQIGTSRAQSTSPSDSATGPSSRSLAPRKLASGVMTVVPPDQDSEDTALGPFDLDFVAIKISICF